MKNIGFASYIGVLLCMQGCSRPEKGTVPTPPASKASAPLFQVDPTTAGSVSGSVLAPGAAPIRTRIDMSEDPACASAHVGPAYDTQLTLGAQGAVTNAFVYIAHGLEGKLFAPSTEVATIDQRGCSFQPRVLGLQVGQSLRILNSDPVTHNIHPMATINRDWNHSQGPGDQPITRRFSKPEVMIPVKCNIHSWMRAYVGVLDHPYFAVTDRNGHFVLPNLPPGTYTVGLWHERLGRQERQVTVAPRQTVTANFSYNAKGKQ